MKVLNEKEKLELKKKRNEANNFMVMSLYKDAEKIFRENIKKYDDDYSKVELAKMYMSGKIFDIDNKKARELLESARSFGCNRGNALLAYMYANGIGGKKYRIESTYIMKQELQKNNPDIAVYYELSKSLPPKFKELKKQLKKCYTKKELRKYKRQVKIDRFNNTFVGKNVNKISNAISRVFEIYNEERVDAECGKTLDVLYNRAKDCYDYEKYEQARAIYRRAANLGDAEAQLAYAQMCYRGIGGEVDLDTSKNIYEDFIIQHNKKMRALKRITGKLDELKEKYEKNKDRRNLKSVKEDLSYYNKKINKESNNVQVFEAKLNYGILLTNNPQNEADVERGTLFLKEIVSKGNLVAGKNKKLNEIGHIRNRYANKAIKQLGIIYENGTWKPKNIEKERNFFCKFTSGPAVKYAGRIADKMRNSRKKFTRNTENKPTISKKKGKNKKAIIAFEVGTLCGTLGLNTLARKCYEKMSQKGDYRCSCRLADYEQYGVGGKVDFEAAKKHYREFIATSFDDDVKDYIPTKRYAMFQLATVLEEECDYQGAVEYYKTAAKKDYLDAKLALRRLERHNLWKAKSEEDKYLIHLKGIHKVKGSIKEFFDVRKENKEMNKEKNEHKEIKRRFTLTSAKTTAAVTAAAVSMYFSKIPAKLPVKKEDFINETSVVSSLKKEEVIVEKNEISIEELI